MDRWIFRGMRAALDGARTNRVLRRLRGAVAAGCACAAGHACASGGIEEADLGAGLEIGPTYVGSNRTVTRPRIFGDIVYRTREGGTVSLVSGSLTIAPTIQFNPVDTRPTGWGMLVGYREGRTGRGSRSPFSYSGDERLGRLPDVRGMAEVGMQAHVTVVHVPVFAIIRSAVTSAESAATVGAYIGGPDGADVQVTVLPTITWSDRRQRNLSYGVSPEASSASGLPSYRLAGGWDNAALELMGDWHVAGAWHVVVSTALQRLLAASTRSPLVSRASQPSVAAGLMWHVD